MTNSDSDLRFDFYEALHLLLDISREQSLGQILQKIILRKAEPPNAHVACLQIWLIEKGDLCSTCPQKPNCANSARCLHLAAGKGVSIVNKNAATAYFEDLKQRIPLNVPYTEEAITTGQQVDFRDLHLHQITIPGFDWLPLEQIRHGAMTPIQFKGEMIGLLCGFTRTDTIPEGALSWARVFANHTGAVIANSRAFDEIQRLKAQLELQNTYLQEEVVEAKAYGDLVGQSAALRQIISQIDLVAPTDASVLILGETGTGKELVAHEIHRRSPRKDFPMVRVNCASIPKDLFESELFGHVKGAFTGAIKDRAGRFETAEGGTLLLDEIGEMPFEMQGKLLRVLQEKRYERVGEDLTRLANVRIIGATNRDLKKLVAEGKFREDLYYRLHVFPIQVPPLRARKDDIPLLANHFIDLSVREMRCSKPRLTRAAVTQLQGYDWPGNLRELRNVIERAVILAHGGTLHFALPVLHTTIPVPVSKPKQESVVVPAFFTEAEMLQHERENLLAVLETAGWKIKGRDGAAELLGIKPTTLISRMKKMGIKRTVPEHPHG